MSRRASILSDLTSGLQQPMPPMVSIRNAMFTLVDSAGVEQVQQLFDQQYGRFLDVVIIGVNPSKSKQYYDRPYDPNVPMAPACFSDNGVAPSVQAQSPQSVACATCPHNAWGSKISNVSGKQVKACTDRKKIAALVCGDPTQLCYQLQIPAASLKNLAVLANALAQHTIQDVDGPRSLDPADVVTRVYFDPHNQGQLLFQPMGYHSQLFPYIEGLIQQVDATGAIDVITGRNDIPRTGALPAPAPVQQLAAPQPQFQQPPQMQAPPPQAAPQFQNQPTQPQFQNQPTQHPQFNGQAPQPQFQNQPAQQPQFQQPPGQPAPQAAPSRRGGARAGAGRRAAPQQQQQAPQQFQQPAQQPAPQQQAPQQFQQPAPQQFQAAPPAQFNGQAPRAGAPVTIDAAPEIPPFLDRTGTQPAPQQFQNPAGPPQGQAYGMGNGAMPNEALSAAIDNAFTQPLHPRQRG